LKVLDNHVLTDLHRGIRYGDGFFDTALLVNGRPVWAQEHLERMHYAARVMALDLPWHDVSDWEKIAMQAWHDQGQPVYGRFRTLIWRQNGHGYRPDGSSSDWRTELENFNQSPLSPSDAVLRLGASPLIKCPPLLPDIKSLSALPYILAEKFAINQGWDDALLRSPQGGLIESSRSNLFYWKEGRCYTPDWNSGCLPGLCAEFLVDFLKKKGYDVERVQEPPTDLMDCTSLWLTNSIRGVQRVSHWNGNLLPRQPEDEMVDAANKALTGL
jgi:branched-subunit amino acid aminotransferase/4-amino-4-deoxychorismate lyase